MKKVYYRNNKAYVGIINFILGRKSKRIDCINQSLRDKGINQRIKYIAGGDKK